MECDGHDDGGDDQALTPKSALTTGSMISRLAYRHPQVSNRHGMCILT